MAVYVSCARRMRICVRAAGAANAPETSTVAIPPLIDTPRSLLPAGTADVTPAAVSAAFGPANRRLIAAVAAPGVRVTVRFVSHSLAPRSNQTLSVIRGPAGDVAAAAGPMPESAATARAATTRGMRGCFFFMMTPSDAGRLQPPFRVTGISTTRPEAFGFRCSGEMTT